MTKKRIFGYIFIVLAILLSLAIIVQLPTFIAVIMQIFAMLSGKLNSSQSGYVLGQAVYWIIHFTATIMFWKYGVRWIKKVST